MPKDPLSFDFSYATLARITGQDEQTIRAVTETYYLDESMLPQPDPEQVLPHLTETATATEVTEAALLR